MFKTLGQTSSIKLISPINEVASSAFEKDTWKRNSWLFHRIMRVAKNLAEKAEVGREEFEATLSAEAQFELGDKILLTKNTQKYKNGDEAVITQILHKSLHIELRGVNIEVPKSHVLSGFTITT